MPGFYRDEKGASDPLELDLQMAVSCHVDPGTSDPDPLEEYPVHLTIEPSVQSRPEYKIGPWYYMSENNPVTYLVTPLKFPILKMSTSSSVLKWK